MSHALLERAAGAPISWGVCEVPGWGLQLEPDRVLGDMRALGLQATEAGPDGYLGNDAGTLRAYLARHDLGLVGGFIGVVLHDPDRLTESLERVHRSAKLFADAGGEVIDVAAIVDDEWSPRIELTDAEWQHIAHALELAAGAAADEGVRCVLHPHWRTLVEQADDVRRILDISDVSICLDTGHLTLGGYDPLELVRSSPERVGHVHLKDVDEAVAARLRDGSVELVHAVQQGLFQPLGDGEVAVDSIVTELERAGYAGWYVLEQDVAISATSPPPADNVRRSIDFLSRVDGREVTGTRSR